MAKKGSIPWNKGLKKETDDRVAKNAKNKKGKGGEKGKELWVERKKKKYGKYYDLIDKPEEWKILCEGCGEKYRIYERFISFWHACNNRDNGDRIIKCQPCCQTGLKRTEEQRQNMSIAAKNKNIDPEKDKIKRKKISQKLRDYHANMSVEEREELGRKILEGQWNKPQEKIDEWLRKRSEVRKAEMRRLGQEDKFIPSYNQNTIPYIVGILNVRYNTEFRHAESKGGEFKIYDKEVDRFYYADAYSEELNIWIEFDESNKFYKGQLAEEHIKRENRVREILGCQIHRIHFNENYY